MIMKLSQYSEPPISKHEKNRSTSEHGNLISRMNPPKSITVIYCPINARNYLKLLITANLQIRAIITRLSLDAIRIDTRGQAATLPSNLNTFKVSG